MPHGGPLAPVAGGVCSVNVAAAFEEFRPFLLGAAPLLIGISFYLIYVRRTPCAEGSACAVRRGSPGRAVRDLDVHGVPDLRVLAPDGTVRAQHNGLLLPAEFAAFLTGLAR